MRVILADPPAGGVGKLQQGPNLGLLYLASYIKMQLPKATFFYVPEGYSLKQHVRFAQEVKPDIYAISCTSYSALRGYKTLETLKSMFPDLRTVIGGPHASAVPIEVIQKSAAHVCVIGEGEVTFGELVQAGSQFYDALENIRGISYRTGGDIRVNPPRSFVEDIDELPMPDRSLVRDTDFAGLPLYRSRPTAEMVVTRGCPYRCVFCSNPVFRPEEIARKGLLVPRKELQVLGSQGNKRPKVGLPLRMRSPEAIAEEANHLYRLGYREIYLHSDELNCSHEWAIEVCEALASLGHRDLFFQTNIRADKVSDEFAGALKRMNMWLVRLGIESASQRVIDEQKKMVSIEQVENACAILASHDIKVFGYFMLFQVWEAYNELHYETVQEVRQSLDFAERLSNRGHLNYIGWSVATPIHGSEMYNILRLRGVLDEDYYPSQRWEVSQHIPGITEKEFEELVKKGLRLQARLALRNGGIGWGNWRRILSKGMRMIVGNVAPRISDFSG
jgi:anaerobic magnesium-protoporphyrin IX monomethyl ester cyclase